MGCLDSIPENSPEGRARELESALKLDQFNCDHIKSAFFLLNEKVTTFYSINLVILSKIVVAKPSMSSAKRTSTRPWQTFKQRDLTLP